METDPNIGSFIVVLIGALTALIAGGVTAYKTVRETDSKVEETKSLVRRAELELDLKSRWCKDRCIRKNTRYIWSIDGRF